MKKFCQGYCGGSYPIEELKSVGRTGEQFCEDCRKKLEDSK